ncbi:MAG: hypothetical protein JW795_14270 [Chitinivibrionales bacterium]|nr:hypothetical protein [Chitinivibrionales bacterium]
MKSSALFFVLGVTLLIISSGVVSAEPYYSNSNRSLFGLPSFSGTAGAGLAFSSDATLLSNPAGSCRDTVDRVWLAYSGFYENAFSTSVFSYVRHSDTPQRFTGGISMGYLHIPDIEVTDKLAIDSKTGFPISFTPQKETSSEMVLNLTLSAILYENHALRLAGGGALHTMRRRLIHWTGYGIGADCGVVADLMQTNVTASLLIEDITTNYIHWSSHYSDIGYPHCRLAVGWHKDVSYLYGTLKIMYKSPDLFSNEGVTYNVMTQDSIPSVKPLHRNPSLLVTAGAYGAEFQIYHTVSLRVGMDESKRTFFGAGVDMKVLQQGFAVDFAYMVPYALPGTYAVCVGYFW